MNDYFWSCHGGSSDSVLWVPIYGRTKRWWHEFSIMPLYRLGRRASKAKWWLFHRFHPRHRYHVINTGLGPGYYDEDTLILHACFAMLERYVECEDGADALEKFSAELRETPDPNAPEGIQSAQADRQDEAVALYRWWKIEKPSDEAKRDALMKEWHEGRGKPETNVRWAVLQAIEEKIDTDEQVMLHRLIEIRRGLWT